MVEVLLPSAPDGCERRQEIYEQEEK